MEIQRGTYATFPQNAFFLKKIFPQDDEKYYYGFVNHNPFFSPKTVFSIRRKIESSPLSGIFHDGSAMESIYPPLLELPM